MSKALRFGVDEVQPGQTLTNAERLHGELLDLLAVWDMLADLRVVPRPNFWQLDCDAIDAKQAKVEKFMAYAVEKGALAPAAVRNMTRSAKGTVEEPGKNVRAKSGLNRSIQDAAFGRLRELLRYKAERAGGELIEVDPRYTSQTCSVCGVIDAASRQSQSQFLCVGCGHNVNADFNASLNIARLGGVIVPSALNLRSV
ncbi:RNA-guided endonuclease InsQ/TnpB family protein [Aureimonas leprariae]|uniref:RNA-guided endonuclease InsQ/TnpB family protein n=1 Tax=Plantimonas leprariae TaxID=2615207 RepID=UPI0013873A36|nr:RNA-guided endonuclease TnpB family protein [Aureimonas leprariae]